MKGKLMSVKEKFISTKNSVVTDLKVNGKKYLTAFGVGVGVGSIYLLHGLIKSHNQLVKVVNNQADVINYDRSHPFLIEKGSEEGLYDVKQLYFPALEQNPPTEK